MSSAAFEIQEADISEERKTLEVRWGDQHMSVYPLKYLRAECPCASCRTERQEAKDNPLRVLTSGSRPASFEIADVEAVGRYGMRIGWRDGHATGIYTFEYLRELCPCDACRAVRKQDDTPYVHGIYIPK